MRSKRFSLLGLEIADADGETVGHVVDTYPFDGGGELELVVVRLRRFGLRRMVPAENLRIVLGRLIAPYTRIQIEDSPDLSAGRHSTDDPYRAKAYWLLEDPVANGPSSAIWPRLGSR
jgi:hypothetical protein